jgi:hypothetical protein
MLSSLVVTVLSSDRFLPNANVHRVEDEMQSLTTITRPFTWKYTRFCYCCRQGCCTTTAIFCLCKLASITNLLFMQPHVFGHVILISILNLLRSWGGTSWHHGRDHLTFHSRSRRAQYSHYHGPLNTSPDRRTAIRSRHDLGSR